MGLYGSLWIRFISVICKIKGAKEIFFDSMIPVNQGIILRNEAFNFWFWKKGNMKFNYDVTQEGNCNDPDHQANQDSSTRPMSLEPQQVCGSSLPPHQRQACERLYYRLITLSWIGKLLSNILLPILRMTTYCCPDRNGQMLGHTGTGGQTTLWQKPGNFNWK